MPANATRSKAARDAYPDALKEAERLLLEQRPGKRATHSNIGVALSDLKFSALLIILGAFFWLPFWCFFNLCAVYVDSNLDTARLYESMAAVLGSGVAGFFSQVDENGVRRILGETISHTGWIIMILQVLVSTVIGFLSKSPTSVSLGSVSSALRIAPRYCSHRSRAVTRVSTVTGSFAMIAPYSSVRAGLHLEQPEVAPPFAVGVGQ